MSSTAKATSSATINNVIPMPVKPTAQAVKEIYTDVWNGENFAGKYAGEVAYVPQRGAWFEFDNHHWQMDDVRHIMQKAIQCTKDMLLDASIIVAQATKLSDPEERKHEIERAQALMSYATKSQSKAKLEAMLSLASSNTAMVVSQGELDSNDMLLGVQNGVIELETLSFREGDPDDYITKQCVAEWSGDSEPCPTWEKFLEEVQPDSEVRMWLQKFAGYCLTGKTSEQIFTVFQGNGANGKSVFVDILKLVMGSYATTAQFDTFCEKDNGSAIRNDVAMLDKIRLVVANEGSEGARIDEGMVKQITGGDDYTARFLHREFFTFKPKFKVILVSNHKPVIKGTDNGIWRRLVLVPWNVTIPSEKRDKKLVDKLKRELNGIFAWMIHGLAMYQDDGLAELPIPLVIANNEYRKDSDIIGLWLEEAIDTDDGFSVTSSALYTNYEQWAKSYGFRPMSQKTLADKLREKGFSPAKVQQCRGWNGLRLKAGF